MKPASRCFLLVMIMFAASCSGEDENTPTKPIEDDFEPVEEQLVKQGMLMGVGHTVSGTVKVYEQGSDKAVVLDPFNSQNGPDLKVYLSKDIGASEYVNLGALKSTMGKQSYTIPTSIDLSSYTYVHIWCEEFSVEFARAPLQ
jgi:hypothetical protein